MACSDHVIHTSGLNKFIKADWQTGRVLVEAGVTLEQIIELALPRGWFLPVTPGTKYVSVAGAVANDVHGKNHHVRGTFGRHICKISLARSDAEICECSATDNTELFNATIGGLGLTGVILWVEIQLMPVSSGYIDTTTIRFNNLSEFFQLSAELDQDHEYSVAWVDCLAKGQDVGRGVFMVGDHCGSGSLDVVRKRKLTVPFTLPFSLINKLSLQLLNSAYYHIHKPGRHRATTPYEPFFYPLDGINHWNRAYGKRGFQQYQCIVPHDQAESVVSALLEEIAAAKTGSFLAVLKRCGDIKSPGLLSFPMPGVSLALDFPQHDAINKRLFSRLDVLVRESGGRLYPAKDAHMSGGDFRVFYPAWGKVEKLRDPAICSKFWKRVSGL